MFKNLWDFEGVWQLDRAIVDRKGPAGHLSGQAVFSREGAGLSYHECGTLHLDGQSPVLAERRYRWNEGRDGTIEVAFEDGRAFHTISRDAARARHNCAPDLYIVVYDFEDWPVWHNRWDVTGPRKDYTMTSSYRRS